MPDASITGRRSPVDGPGAAGRVGSPGEQVLVRWRVVHWFSTGLLIALSAGTAAWAGWLLRRLFVVEPAAPYAEPTGQAEPRDDDSEEP